MRDAAGSAATPAARCRKFRRGSFILILPLASHHSITSSARASRRSGTVRPSVLAVFMLKVGVCRLIANHLHLAFFERTDDSRLWANCQLRTFKRVPGYEYVWLCCVCAPPLIERYHTARN